VDCFEVRREFAEFWRGSIEEERRRKLLEHLRNCAGCDRAFRAFALTAPVLHSDSRPVAMPSDGVSHRPASSAPKPRVWLAATAVATLTMAATVAVYLAVAAPRQTLDEALSPQDSLGELGPSSPFDLTSAG
jgi:hypothetical protein